MKALEELICNEEPAIELIKAWVSESEIPVETLPPSSNRENLLVRTQVTTRSPMGAIVYETGGILVANGWLRFLGSGHPKLKRTLPEWNEGRSDGFYLIADDVVGGFFALNGGAFGEDTGDVYYWAPDSLEWEPMGVGYSEFFQWALTSNLTKFYSELRWDSWAEDIKTIDGDTCFIFYPYLWTEQGSLVNSERGIAPASEVYSFNLNAGI